MRAGDIFDLLRDGKPWTRAELAEATGLARSTIAGRIDVLMRLELVAPFGGARSTGGRPPALFAFNPRARVVAGVDVGATHVRVALTDLASEILAETSTSLDVSEGPDTVLAWVVEAVDGLLGDADRTRDSLAAIGIGLPGPVEFSTGRPFNPPIMPGWNQYDVPGRLQRAFPVPVLVDNDVNIMALGEHQALRPGIEDLVLLKVATGIGCGIVSGGVLQRGAQGTAGDIGHVRVPDAEDITCRCGNTGCLEAVAAGPAVAKKLSSQGVPASSGRDVLDLVSSGNHAAIAAVRQAGRDIGEVTAMMINLLNPSVVAIGGQLSGAGEHLIAGIRETVYHRSLPLATEKLEIKASLSGPEAAILGASAMAAAHVLSPEAVESASLALVNRVS